jgi:putative copper resistance protein D
MTVVIPTRPAGSYARNMRGVYLASVCLHVLAAMTWVGGMVIFVAAVMPYFRNQDDKVREAFLQWFGARFRTLSWTCFAVLAVTGFFNLWMRGVRIEDFLRAEWRGTAFGHLVLVKLALVVLAVATAALHERPATRRQARWLGRSLLLFGLAIVAVAVMLVRAA